MKGHTQKTLRLKNFICLLDAIQLTHIVHTHSQMLCTGEIAEIKDKIVIIVFVIVLSNEHNYRCLEIVGAAAIALLQSLLLLLLVQMDYVHHILFARLTGALLLRQRMPAIPLGARSWQRSISLQDCFCQVKRKLIFL